MTSTLKILHGDHGTKLLRRPQFERDSLTRTLSRMYWTDYTYNISCVYTYKSQIHVLETEISAVNQKSSYCYALQT